RVNALGNAGFLKAVVPAEAGGMHPRLDVRTLCLAREILAFRDGLADFAFAMQGLGSASISLFGSAALKARYLPPVAAGDAIAARGFARRALHETLARAANRKLFGAPLAELQLTQAAIADSASEVDASALLVYRAAWTKDQGAPRVTREAAIAKMFASEAAQRVIDRAVQLHGGLGVTKGVKVEE